MPKSNLLSTWESVAVRKLEDVRLFWPSSPWEIFKYTITPRLSEALQLQFMAKAEVIRTSLALCVILLPSVLKARRCDRQVDSFVWSNCNECSVNAFLPNPCPSGYSQITTGEGVQRCSYLVHFGFNFGLMSVPGCQHNCTRKVTQKQCCEGFWGTDCQGIVAVKVSCRLISVKPS